MTLEAEGRKRMTVQPLPKSCFKPKCDTIKLNILFISIRTIL